MPQSKNRGGRPAKPADEKSINFSVSFSPLMYDLVEERWRSEASASRSEWLEKAVAHYIDNPPEPGRVITDDDPEFRRMDEY